MYNGQLGRYGGDNAIGVYAVVASIMAFVIMPASGISQGIQPIVDNNYGAGRFRRVMSTLYQASGLSVGIACVIWALVKPVPSIVITLLRQIAFLIPFIYLFPLILGVNGIFLAQPVSDALALAISIARVVREHRAQCSSGQAVGLEAAGNCSAKGLFRRV